MPFRPFLKKIGPSATRAPGKLIVTLRLPFLTYPEVMADS